MQAQMNKLGGRLALLNEGQLNEEQRAVWARLMATQAPEAARAGFRARDNEGHFLGPFNAYIRFPTPGTGLLDWASAQIRTAALSAAARQVVTLAVGAVWRAPFEIQAHVAGALAEGVSRDAVRAVLSRRDHVDLTDESRAARMVADALLVEHLVDDPTYTSAVAVLGEDGIAAVAHLVGQYVAVSALLIAFDVPVDDLSS